MRVNSIFLQHTGGGGVVVEGVAQFLRLGIFKKQDLVDRLSCPSAYRMQPLLFPVLGGGGEPDQIPADDRCGVSLILQRQPPDDVFARFTVPFDWQFGGIRRSHHAIQSRTILIGPEERQRRRRFCPEGAGGQKCEQKKRGNAHDNEAVEQS